MKSNQRRLLAMSAAVCCNILHATEISLENTDNLLTQSNTPSASELITDQQPVEKNKLHLPELSPEQLAIPSDAELEAAGAVIGTIEVDNQDIFDPTDPREDKAIFRLANRLHIETTPSQIRQKILVQPGDPYSRRLLEESARILRAQSYLYDAKITPIRYIDGRVDIRVSTRDVWSLTPGVDYGRSGGKTTYAIELEESNLLGKGISLGVAQKSSIDRDTLRLRYIDRSFMSSRQEFMAQYSDNSDGKQYLLSLELPFYALDSRWARGILLDKNDRIDSLYQLGEVTHSFREQSEKLELYAARSRGLQDGRGRRWFTGYTIDDRKFEALPDALPTAIVPENRNLRYPWIGWELIEDSFETQRNQDQIDRTEDIFLGTRLQARLGYSDDVFGADRSSVIYNFEIDYGQKYTPNAKLTLATRLNGRYENDSTADLLLETRLRYYLKHTDRWLFFTGLSLFNGSNLDQEHQVLLGGDNGLRGYPLRYQAGDKAAIITVEERYFTNLYLFRLFRVGAAVFLDAGRTWGGDSLDTENFGTIKNFGIGLRLGNTRTSLGNVIHIDLGYPLDGPDDIRKVQLTLQTKTEF